MNYLETEIEIKLELQMPRQSNGNQSGIFHQIASASLV